MFGHQDDSEENQPNDLLTAPVADGTLEHDHLTAPAVQDDFNPALPATDADQPVPSPDHNADFSLPTGASDSADNVVTPEPEAEAPTPEVVVPATADPVSSPANDDLLDIKQQALTQLTPLVDQLDQSPEEKFRTTMMMIQAADNKVLVPKAYEAAQAIVDEKVKAQALLDIVNEINYFTQHTA